MSTVKIQSTDLHRILTDAALFASKDSGLPTINAVSLECDGINLIATGTDRFMLGVSKADCVEPADQFSILLSLDQVRLIGTLLRPPRRRVVRQVTELRVTPKARRLYVKVGTASLLIGGLQDYRFPNWRALIPRHATAEEANVYRGWEMNPEKLATFGRVGNRASFYSSGPTTPLMVRVGDDFVGLVMPIRPADGVGLWSIPEWVSGGPAAD